MQTTFTLEDIRDFLKQQYGIDWGFEVWDRKTGKKRRATIEDFDYSGRYSTTELAFYYDKHGIDCNLEVYVTDFDFITYREESNIMGSGSTTYVDKNFIKDWIGFLSYTHEEKYAKTLLAHALYNKQRIKQEAEEKIEKFRLKTQQEAKGPYMYYRGLEQKAKSILTVGEILEVEQPNNPSRDENSLGIRYYDSNTMTIRNTNGKDEEDILSE